MKTCGFQPLMLGLSVLLSVTSVCKKTKRKAKVFSRGLKADNSKKPLWGEKPIWSRAKAKIV